MSPRRPNLSSPPLAIGVLLVLAAVIAFNFKIFAPQMRRARAVEDARAQTQLPLPDDLNQIGRDAGRTDGQLGVPRSGPRPDLARDPFTSRSVAVAGIALGGLSGPGETAPRKKPPVVGTPVCTAVMLGGGEPAALIDGILCREGDRVRQFQVERITATGVTLAGDGGRFLPVGVASGGAGSSLVVTGAPNGDAQGRTSLVEYAETERKKP